jgi:hypothetical protein
MLLKILECTDSPNNKTLPGPSCQSFPGWGDLGIQCCLVNSEKDSGSIVGSGGIFECWALRGQAFQVLFM